MMRCNVLVQHGTVETELTDFVLCTLYGIYIFYILERTDKIKEETRLCARGRNK